MRAFRGVNLKTIDDSATRTALQAVDQYARQTGRALSRSIAGGQTPQAITILTINPAQGTSFIDDTWLISDGAAPSKRMRFELSSVTPGITQTLTVPDQSGVIALTSDIPSITLPLPIADGGTGQTTQIGAINALLPSKVGKTLQFLRVNAGETDVEWTASSVAFHQLLSGTHVDTTPFTPSLNGDMISSDAATITWKRLVRPAAEVMSPFSYVHNDGTTTVYSPIPNTDLPQHASLHEDGSDPIRLDQLGLPIDTGAYGALLDFNNVVHGLCPKAPAVPSSDKVLASDGTWVTPIVDHDLLTGPGGIHPDTNGPFTPVAGDLMYSDSSPLWSPLAIGGRGDILRVSAPIAGDHFPEWVARGASGTFLRSDGTDSSFSTIAETDIVDGSLLARLAANETITGTWTHDANLQFSDTNKLFKWGSSPFATLSSPTVSVNTAWLLPVDGGTLIPKVGIHNGFAQTNSIGTTTIYTAAADGMFRYSFYIKTTTAGTAGDVVKATVLHNDGTAQTTDVALWPCTTGAGAIVQSLTHDLATNNVASFGSAVVYSLSGQTLRFSTTVTKTGSPQYTIIVRLDALS